MSYSPVLDGSCNVIHWGMWMGEASIITLGGNPQGRVDPSGLFFANLPPGATPTIRAMSMGMEYHAWLAVAGALHAGSQGVYGGHRIICRHDDPELPSLWGVGRGRRDPLVHL